MEEKNLFDDGMGQPLAARLRPESLADYVGQEHLLGKGKVLRRMIENDSLSSMIFWGPPGVGKTTLAQIIARVTKSAFLNFSAVSSGIREIRKVMEEAERNRSMGIRTVVFVDEIHRFNKAQQDAFLPYVEKGSIILIGATTENPSFEVIRPLLSRAQVYTLNPLDVSDLQILLDRALQHDELLSKRTAEVRETTALFRYAGGDARKLLNILDLIDQSTPAGQPMVITDAIVTSLLQTNPAAYDKGGEMHYDIISAFIKSMRGSDPDGAVYWLARMVEGGEDPEFIARRMVILAAEDIGLANPNALLLANATFDALKKIGWPEGRIILSECAIYLATSPKSNTAYMAIGKAQAEVRRSGNLPVPLHLRNAPTKLMSQLGYGKGYKYAHDYEGNTVEQQFLPSEIDGTRFWQPGNNAAE